ncbi:membrane protein [Brevibacillus laterosporus]|nr:membrane protein [Brevibacillus laterosporus]MBG9787406.1 membrane protein [Brevibacillus laterosporus]MBG9799772.1 membrane protein [Brevibacillus laterosporus]MBG9801998.1 membrane protein [Brevibacillus laterosporus]
MPAKEKQAPLRYIVYVFFGVTIFLGALWGLLMVLDIFSR